MKVEKRWAKERVAQRWNIYYFNIWYGTQCSGLARVYKACKGGSWSIEVGVGSHRCLHKTKTLHEAKAFVEKLFADFGEVCRG